MENNKDISTLDSSVMLRKKLVKTTRDVMKNVCGMFSAKVGNQNKTISDDAHQLVSTNARDTNEK